MSKKSMQQWLSVIVAISICAAPLGLFANNRRLTPAAYCDEAGTGGNSHPLSYGYIEGDSGGFVTCGIPSDTWFSHDDINTINVHIYKATTASTYARPCVYKYNDHTTITCDSAKYKSSTGEQTISFSTASSELDNFTAAGASSWASSVYVQLVDGDTLNLIWVSE